MWCNPRMMGDTSSKDQFGTIGKEMVAVFLFVFMEKNADGSVMNVVS